MGEAVGLSYLYPFIPLYSLASTVLLLMLIPGFWKTRVFCLVANVCWIALGNVLIFIGSVGWRGHTRDIPIYADILAAVGYMQRAGSYLSMVCVAKFVWQRLRPLSAREFYDNRRKHNQIDAFMTIVLPVLWLPSRLFSASSRYSIIEDYGPAYNQWMNLPGFLATILPSVVCSVGVAIFNTLALLTYLRVKKSASDSEFSKRNNTMRTRKLMMFSFGNVLLAGLAISITLCKQLQHYPVSKWVPPTTIAYNLQYFQRVVYLDAQSLETTHYSTLDILTIHSLSWPALGLYMFLWFGIGAEARKSYRDAIWYLLRLVGIKTQDRDPVLSEAASSYWTGRSTSSRYSRDSLPTAGGISPFPSSTSDDPEARPLPSAASDSRFGSSSIADIKRGATQPLGGMSRISYQKPPLPVGARPIDAFQLSHTAQIRPFQHKAMLPVPLADVLLHKAEECDSDSAARRISSYKLPLPVDVSTLAVNVPRSTLPRRSSCHKPPMPRPLAAALEVTAPRWVSSHRPNLPTTPADIDQWRGTPTEDASVSVQPIQLFLPPTPHTLSPMMPLSIFNGSL